VSLLREVRLDVYIAETLCLMRRSQIKRRALCAIVNGKKAKYSTILKNGDRLDLVWNDIPELLLTPEHIPLDIVFENERVVVVNKAQGMIVHPGAGAHNGTLVNALLGYLQEKNKNKFDNLLLGSLNPHDLRPFIVHRLDKDTSGLIICAWDNECLSFLSDQFKERSVKKTYVAIVKGVPEKKSGVIATNIIRDPKERKQFTISTESGKSAVTYYKLLRAYKNFSLLLLRPKTGRTHQLRVHLRYLGNPILGDTIYNKTCKEFPAATLMLHARKLSITLPGNTEMSHFKTELPLRFKNMLRHACK
jgi:23S rRNA pseudouridine1911/1915/1917 synthase